VFSVLGGQYRNKIPKFINSLRHAFIAACLGAVLAGMPGIARAVDCPQKPSAHLPEATQPLNLGEIKLQLLDYLCFGAYDRDIEKVLAGARAHVEQRADEVEKPALVLDIDETSLSNRPFFLANDFGTIMQGACKLDAGKSVPDEPCGFNAWLTEHEAKAIDPTLKLFNLAKSKNVAVFFITGRRDNERLPTIANLKKAGYEGWTDLMMRAPDDQTPVGMFKMAERAKIAARGFTIIANVGDQRSDLDGGYAERTFRVPNPFYFLP
jgi:HAD superfamily, subfamily IIIB (Acid phosphatase)